MARPSLSKSPPFSEYYTQDHYSSSVVSDFTILFRLAVIESPPQAGFPAPDASQKKFNSRLVAPIERKAYRSKRLTLTRRGSAVRLQPGSFVEYSTKPRSSTLWPARETQSPPTSTIRPPAGAELSGPIPPESAANASCPACTTRKNPRPRTPSCFSNCRVTSPGGQY